MIELKSVGSILDPVTGITYPANADGTPDMEQPCHLEDIESEEFFTNLSDVDVKTICQVKKSTVHTTGEIAVREEKVRVHEATVEVPENCIEIRGYFKSASAPLVLNGPQYAKIVLTMKV